MSESLERLLGRARRRNFFDEEGEKAPVYRAPTERNSVQGDGFDRQAWEYLADQLPVVKEQVCDLAKDYPTSPVAYEDLFRLLNKADPQLIEPDGLEPLYRPQWAIAAGLKEAEDLQYVRNQTKFDSYTTGIAIMTMADRMREAFENLQDALDAIAAAQQMLDAMIEAAQEAMESGQGQDAAEGALQRAMQAMGEAEAEAQERGEELSQATVRGLGEAKKELDRQADAARAYGLNDGDLQRMSFEERQELAGHLDHGKMKRFADLVGQFAQHQDAERRRKVTRAPSEIHDIEMGNDLRRVTMSELANLATPELEELFWIRFVKHELQQWKVKGADNAGRGPILVVCDESGSMSASLGESTREAWSKAVSLALANQAKQGKRDFHYIGFSSEGQVWHTSFEKGHADISDVTGFVEHFFAGGTAYERPLEEAAAICRSYSESGMKRPDIVFITDDDCQVPDEFVARWQADRAALDIQCYGVRVGSRAEDGWRSAMSSLCDRIININNLTAQPEDVKDLWRFI